MTLAVIKGRTRSAPGRRQRGFTLLEVLLAFVIFALGFATVMEILSGSLRSAVRAREYSEAALTAQSLMDMVGTEIPLLEGSQSGSTETGFDWSLDIVPFEPQDENPRPLEVAEMNGTVLLRVDLRLAWRSGIKDREVWFSTVRGRMVESMP